MQLFANRKHSFIGFYVIQLKNQEEKFDHSGTLNITFVPVKCKMKFKQFHLPRPTEKYFVAGGIIRS